MQFIVKELWADLYREPREDAERISQVLQGFSVEVSEKIGPWVGVFVPEQRQWECDRWQGYAGWMLHSSLKESKASAAHVVVDPSLADLPYGVRLQEKRPGTYEIEELREMPLEKIRARIVQEAEQLVGLPYLWGGGVALPEVGVDCSGLVHLLLSSYGRIFPRDARDQVRVCSSIRQEELEPGDLLFSSSQGAIDHVMLYIGEGEVVEAKKCAGVVRKIRLEEIASLAPLQFARLLPE